MPFDESSAVLDEAPQFDAASAKPEFDEASAVEDSLGATAASAGSSPGVGSIPPAKTPTIGDVLSAQGDILAEAARRVGSGIAEAATTAAAGLSRISEFTPPTMLGRVIAKQLTGEDPLQKGREFLGEAQRAAKPSFGVDPTKDKELVSKVIAGATSLVPIIASGPAAPLTAAGLMGESARQDAEAHGATEGQKAAAFAGGATIGVISEALLGIPALLRSAKAAGATDAVLKSISRQAVEQGLKNTVRESSQEAIEQVSQNLLANTVVGYDPTRETSSGVLEAAGLGAAIGGPVGALVQTAVTLDARTDASFEQLKQEAESVAAPEAPEIAVPETPVETAAAPEIAAAERAPAQTPAPPVGQSNLTAAVEKNIADARMMAPDDPAGFLRKMADSSRKQGKEEAAANFEAAITELEATGLPEGFVSVGASTGADIPKPGKIGGYNADVEARQKARGQTPTMSEARKEDPVTWNNAMEAIEKQPNAPDALVERIHEDPKKPITDEEQQMLTWRRGDLENKMAMEAERAADPTLSPEEQAAAQSQAEFYESQLLRTEQANRMAGTASGRSLRSRQMEMNDDYTLSGIMMRARKQKGDVLTAEERSVIKKQADEIAALQARVMEGEQSAARTQVLEATIADLQKTPKFGKEVFDIARKKVAEWRAAADAVDSDIRSYLGSETGAVGDVGPQKGKGLKLGQKASERAFITKVALKIRAKIGEFGLDFAESSAALIAEYGAAIQPYLQKAWVQAQQMIGREVAPSKVKQALKEGVAKPAKGEKAPADVRARAKAEAAAKMELSNKTAYEAVRAVINSGVKGELNIMNGALTLLKEAYPDLTLEKLDVAFSEYGKAKYPSTEATKVELAKLRRLRQMQAAIEDVKRRGETAKSGVQRAKADADVRKRQKELKDAIEEHGKEVPTTPEQLANRERIELTRYENAIADLSRELETGEARLRAEPRMPSVQKEQLQSELAAMRELQQELKAAKNPPVSPAQKALDAALIARERAAQTLDDISTGKLKPDSPEAKDALTQLEEDVRLETEALKAMAAEMRRDAKPKTDPEYAKEQARIKALESAIERYSQKTAASDFSATPKVEGPDTARVAALKEIRDSRRAAYDAAKKAGRPVVTPEERYNATRAKQIEKQLTEAERRIREGDFAPRAKKVQPALTKENLDAKAKLEEKKNEVRRGEERFRLEQRTKMRKVWDGIKQTKQAWVNIFSTLDLSAPRQGLVYVLRNIPTLPFSPGMIGRPARDMVQALFSKAGADRIDQRIKARANRKNGLDKMSNTQFQEYNNTSFTKGEENARSILDEWANEPFRTGSTAKTSARALPLAGAKAVHASNRAFVTFLNSARAELLDRLAAINFKDRPPTPTEVKLMGDMVNLATGRGNMNPKVASALGYTGMWSPNLLISRLQFLIGQPFFGAVARGEGRAAKIVAKEYARVIAGGYILYKISQLFNEDEEKKSTSSDFGKIIRKGEGGDTRVDLWGGFQQQTVLAERFRKAESTTLDGKTRKLPGRELLLTGAKFYRSKLRPDVGIAADILLRENYKGDKTTPASVAKGLVPVPLSMQELVPLLRAHGLGEAAALEAVQMFGAGVSNYADDAKADKARAR